MLARRLSRGILFRQEKVGSEMKTRTNACSQSTNYSYFDSNKSPILKSIDHLATAGTEVNITAHTGRGYPATVVDAAGQHNLTYHVGGALQMDDINGSGILSGYGVAVLYDTQGRRSALAVDENSTPVGPTAVVYSYDSSGRLSEIASGNDHAVRYTYAQNSSFVGGRTFMSEGVPKMQTRRILDEYGRFKGIQNEHNAVVYSSHTYKFDALGRRTEAELEDGSRWLYSDYNSRGELKEASKRLARPSTDRYRGTTFRFDYDNIGNRTSKETGGNTTGTQTRTTTYGSINALNQQTSVTNPSTFDVSGEAPSTLSVTVDGSTADRQDDYFHKEVNHVMRPGLKPLTVTQSGSTPVSGDVYVPPSPETVSYDYDGNRTTDGRWDYTWDTENRLTEIKTSLTSGTSRSSTKSTKVQFDYDYLGRRIRKQVYDTALSTMPSKTILYLWDGWNCIAEIDGTDSQFYVWGKDISGTQQGAGGVEGLLFVHELSLGYAVEDTHCAGYDGNGNVVVMVDCGATPGDEISARFEYSPFGKEIRRSGSFAKKNPFRFSTKYTDDETGMLYYGYRYYDPIQGRWLSRDPIGEEGGLNLYGFVGNCGVQRIDALGMRPWNRGALDRTPFERDSNGNLVDWEPDPQDWDAHWTDVGRELYLHTESELQQFKSTLASKLSTHYLNGSGRMVTIDFNDLILQEGNLQKHLIADIEDAVYFADSLHSGGKLSSQGWKSYRLGSEEYFWALGEIVWAGEGDLEFDQWTGGRVKRLTLRYHMWDPYDFKNDPDAPAGPKTTDADWYRMHKVGRAREFLVVGNTSEITVTWCSPLKDGATIGRSTINFGVNNHLVAASSSEPKNLPPNSGRNHRGRDIFDSNR